MRMTREGKRGKTEEILGGEERQELTRDEN